MPGRPPASPLPVNGAQARAERRARALEEPLDVRLKADDAYPLLEVRNPIHRTSYFVMLIEAPAPRPALCTCTDFARRGLGTCKHLEAAIRWWPGPPAGRPRGPASRGRRPTEVWAEVDARRAAVPTEARWTAQSLSRLGGALWE